MGNSPYKNVNQRNKGAKNQGAKWYFPAFTLVGAIVITILVLVALTWNKTKHIHNDHHHDDDDEKCLATGDPNFWPSWSHDLDGTNMNPVKIDITEDNVHTLDVQCKIESLGENPPVSTNSGGISTTPTFAGDLVYYTDYKGYVRCVNVDTCAIVWEHFLEDTLNAFFPDVYIPTPGFGPQPPIMSRSAPAIGTDPSNRELVVIGDLGAYNNDTSTRGVNLYAFNRFTGATAWIKTVAENPFQVATTSQSIDSNLVFFGLASNEVVPVVK